jgi:hypothetical protein
MSDRPASAGAAAERPGARPGFLRRHNGLAATALAASLVLGVFAGQLKVFNSTADILLGSDGSSSATTGRQIRQMAQTDDADSFLDEDLL